MSETLWKERQIQAEALAEQVLSLTGEFRCIGEREQEANWRKERYQECIDLVSGYETYHLYQPSTLLFETERVLPESLTKCLDALLETDIDVFGRVCSQSASVTWPLRIIDRLSYNRWDDKVYSDIVKLMGLLHVGQQGVLIAHAWERLTDGTETKDRLLLENIWSRLPIEITLMVSALTISDMIPGAFLSSFGSNAGWQEKQARLRLLLDWLASWIQMVRPSAEEVTGKFVDHLYSPVNKEPVWAGYILAKKLEENGDPVICHISEKVQRYLLSLYPTYWVTDSGGVHFCGSLTVDLIDAMASAAVKLPQGELTALFEHNAIPSPQKLWCLRDVHDYQAYFTDVRRALFHELLKVSILNRVDDTCRQDYIDKVFRSLIKYARQARYEHLSYDDKILWSKLLKEISLFSAILKSEKQQEFIVDFTACLDDLWLVVEMVRHVQDARVPIETRGRISKQIYKRQYLLRNVELLEVGGLLYSVGEHELALMLLSMVNPHKFDGWQIAYWKQYSALCHVQMAILSQDEAGQIAELRSALNILQKKYQHEHNASEQLYAPVLLHVMGLLVARGVVESTRLAYIFRSLRAREIASQERWLADAFTMLRLAKADEQELNFWYKELDLLCKDKKIHDDADSTHNLLIAWYFTHQLKRCLTSEEKRVLDACWDKVVDEKQWLPQQLADYIEGYTGRLPC